VLLPFTPEWYWLMDRKDSPWNPSIRLYRLRAIFDRDFIRGRVVAD